MLEERIILEIEDVDKKWMKMSKKTHYYIVIKMITNLKYRLLSKNCKLSSQMALVSLEEI